VTSRKNLKIQSRKFALCPTFKQMSLKIASKKTRKNVLDVQNVSTIILKNVITSQSQNGVGLMGSEKTVNDNEFKMQNWLLVGCSRLVQSALRFIVQ